MRKSIVLSILALLTSVSMQAKHITSSEALQLAFHKSNSRTAKSMSALKYQLAYTARGFYAYNNSAEDGFIILAADDCVQDIMLGYTDRGTFDYVLMPAAMKEWLNMMDDEVTQLSAIKAKYPNHVSSSLDTLETIEPLVKTKWDQGSPYNLMTPLLSDSTHSIAGCVAVAMAQIMSKHKWPTSYDWDNICDTYGSKNTAEQNNAVAKLMLDCGVSVNSSYTSGGTTANIIDVGPAFVEDFDYDKSLKHLRRYFYTKREWRDLLYNNIANGMPIYYRGTSDDGGHAFVCDGYKDGLFHINWGWSGLSDGYFQIALLDPAEQGLGGSTSGFQMNQEAILGIKPNAGGSVECLMYCDENFTTTISESSTTGKANFWGKFENETYTTAVFNLGVKLVDDAGNVQYIASPNLMNKSMMAGKAQMSMSIPFSDATLSEGKYIVTPAYQVCGEDCWRDMRINKSVSHQYVSILVDTNGNITLSQPTTDKSLTVTSISPRTRIIAGYDTDIDYAVKSPESDYLGYVYVAFLESGSNTVVNKSSKELIDLAEEEEFSYTSVISNPKTPGTYDLVLLDNEGNIISNRLSVTVEEVPTGDITLKGTLTAVSKAVNDLQFKLHLQCTSGIFNNKITVFLYNSAWENVGSIPGKSRTFLIEVDDAVDILFSGSFDLKVGDWYTACAYYANPSWTEIAEKTFRTAAATGIEEIQTEQTANSATFNILGQRVDTKTKGLVIRCGKKVLNR